MWGWLGRVLWALADTHEVLSAPFSLGCDFAAPNSQLVLNLPGAFPHQGVALEKWDVKGLVQNSPCETLWGCSHNPGASPCACFGSQGHGLGGTPCR